MAAMKKIQVLALGGTIAMTPGGGVGSGVSLSLTGEQLLAAVPMASKVADIRAETFKQTVSANLTFEIIHALDQRIGEVVAEGYDGIVVTQGTDTLEETAFLLSLIADYGIPIIITGAMRHPTQPSGDGPANVMASIVTAASDWAKGSGVYIAMNDQIMDPVFTRKRHTSSVAAFQAENGPLALVVEQRVHGLSPGRVTRRLKSHRLKSPADIAVVAPVYSDDAKMLDLIAESDFGGLVIEGFGGGHLPEVWTEKVQALALKMPVVLTSRTGGGPVLTSTYGYKGGEMDMIERGIITAGWLDARKARLLLALTAHEGQSAVDDYFAEYRA